MTIITIIDITNNKIKIDLNCIKSGSNNATHHKSMSTDKEPISAI